MNAYNKHKIHAFFSRSAMIRPLYVYYTRGEGKWHNLCLGSVDCTRYSGIVHLHLWMFWCSLFVRLTSHVLVIWLNPFSPLRPLDPTGHINSLPLFSQLVWCICGYRIGSWNLSLDFADFVLFFVRPVISVGSNEMRWKEMLLLLRLENVAWFFCTSEFTGRISLAL